MGNFRITVASVPDREELIAEISFRDFQWAEISHEGEEMLIQFYSHPTEKYWDFPLEEALQVLEKAKQKMLVLGPKNPIPLDKRFKK